jgi:hypothetical protein
MSRTLTAAPPVESSDELTGVLKSAVCDAEIVLVDAKTSSVLCYRSARNYLGYVKEQKRTLSLRR